ncbi:leucine-rich repeat domain-containing protein [Psychroserpens sp.]
MKKISYIIIILLVISCKKPNSKNGTYSNSETIDSPKELIEVCPGIDLQLQGTYHRSELMEQLARDDSRNPINKLPLKARLGSLLKSKDKVTHLSLANLDLVELPEEIFQFEELIAINLSGNNFKNKEKLVEDLARFPNLKILRMIWSKLTKLPDNIELLSNLEVLSLASNNIKVLSEDLGKLTNLKLLSLTNNRRLEDLPESIGDLKCLQLLDVSGTSLTQLREEIANNTELVIINANASKIKTIPKHIGNLTKLVTLNLAANKLTKIPKSIDNLGNLQNLSLSSNDISEIPSEISNLKKVQFISLEFNRFKIFPREVLGLDGCYNLWVHNNVFPTIPEEVGRMKSLSHLLVDHEIITDENIEAIKNVNPNLRVMRHDTRRYVKGLRRKN